jgi:hypothetical protein
MLHFPCDCSATLLQKGRFQVPGEYICIFSYLWEYRALSVHLMYKVPWESTGMYHLQLLLQIVVSSIP